MIDRNSAMTLIPCLCIDGASSAIDFYKNAFDAQETLRLIDPNDGRVGHAELIFGTQRVMISDEYPDFGAVAPGTLGGTPVKFVLIVSDADEVYERALKHGAVSLRKLRNEFHGHRTGQVIDPFGHIWFIQSKIDDLTPSEMQTRWNATMAT